MNNFIFDTLRLTDTFNTMNRYDVVNLVWKGNVNNTKKEKLIYGNI